MDRQQQELQKLQALIAKNKPKTKANVSGKDSKYWQIMGEIAYFLGFEAYLYAKHDLMTVEEGNELVRAIRRIRAEETINNANATRAASANKPSGFKKALSSYIKAAKG